MGLVDKAGGTVKRGSTKKLELSKDEANFIILKLRQGNFKGTEFEMFYHTIRKLQEYIENN
jgi:hypothetical protein|tara:strand:- start:190 stop:372 length:183 start_codon:yes stop_codon:yes gene_type:complete